jgi:hypothetical protein
MMTTSVSWSWLYLRCVLWGLAVGVGAGVGVGVPLGVAYFGTVGGAGSGALIGAVYAIPIALLPALLGAAVVASVTEGRDDFRRSLGIAFAVTAGVVNVALLLAIALWGDAVAVLVLLAGDAGALPMLWWTWASISRAAD